MTSMIATECLAFCKPSAERFFGGLRRASAPSAKLLSRHWLGAQVIADCLCYRMLPGRISRAVRLDVLQQHQLGLVLHALDALRILQSARFCDGEARGDK